MSFSLTIMGYETASETQTQKNQYCLSPNLSMLFRGRSKTPAYSVKTLQSYQENSWSNPVGAQLGLKA